MAHGPRKDKLMNVPLKLCVLKPSVYYAPFPNISLLSPAMLLNFQTSSELFENSFSYSFNGEPCSPGVLYKLPPMYGYPALGNDSRS